MHQKWTQRNYKNSSSAIYQKYVLEIHSKFLNLDTSTYKDILDIHTYNSYTSSKVYKVIQLSHTYVKFWGKHPLSLSYYLVSEGVHKKKSALVGIEMCDNY